MPWGISESAYNARDLDLTYQYSNFGVPGLGLKRGLSEDVVIAPYATALAAMVDPRAAARNFARLTRVGGGRRYGFYEALDYTPPRLPDGRARRRSSALHGAPSGHDARRARQRAPRRRDARALPRRARSSRPPSSSCRSARPATCRWRGRAPRRCRAPRDIARLRAADRCAGSPRRTTRSPRTHLLSNGRYAVMLTAAGSGLQPLAATSRSPAGGRTSRAIAWGSFVFLRDVQSGAVWSAGYQPTGVEPDSYEVTFSRTGPSSSAATDRITTTLEVLVSPEDDAEIRRVSLTQPRRRRPASSS